MFSDMPRPNGGSIGEHYEEITLWNDGITATTQAAQDITLSDDIDNYEYLKFYTKTLLNPEVIIGNIIEVSDFKNCTAVANSKPYFVVGTYTGTTYSSARRIKYLTNTTIHLDTSYVFNSAAGAQPTHNIVAKITGLKKVGGSESNIGYEEFDITIPANTKLDLSIPTEKRAKRIIGNLYNMSTTSNTYSIDASDGDTKTKRLWNLSSLGTQLNVTFTDNLINLVQASGTTFSANNYKFLGMILY